MSDVFPASRTASIRDCPKDEEAALGAGQSCASDSIRLCLRAPHAPESWPSYFATYVARFPVMQGLRVLDTGINGITHAACRKVCAGCRKLEACLWILASLALCYFGNGEHDTLYVLRHDPRIYRPALFAAVMAGSVNGLVFLYVHVWVRIVHKPPEDLELVVPWAIPLATAAFIICGLGFMSACWGVWNWITPVLGIVHLMALVMSISFLPGVTVKEHQR